MWLHKQWDSGHWQASQCLVSILSLCKISQCLTFTRVVEDVLSINVAAQHFDTSVKYQGITQTYLRETFQRETRDRSFKPLLPVIALRPCSSCLWRSREQTHISKTWLLSGPHGKGGGGGGASFLEDLVSFWPWIVGQGTWLLNQRKGSFNSSPWPGLPRCFPCYFRTEGGGFWQTTRRLFVDTLGVVLCDTENETKWKVEQE